MEKITPYKPDTIFSKLLRKQDGMQRRERISDGTGLETEVKIVAL